MRLLLVLTSVVLLAGCDIPGLGPDPRVLRKESDSKAIGGACRYAQRGIEDCYTLNPKASKTAIFEGWREMDQYMRENKIEGQPSTLAENGKDSGDKAESDGKDKAAANGKH